MFLTTRQFTSNVFQAVADRLLKHGPFPSDVWDWGGTNRTITTPEISLAENSCNNDSCDDEPDDDNFTPEMTPPTIQNLKTLWNEVKSCNIPVTQSTHGVMTKFAQNPSKMYSLLCSKPEMDKLNSCSKFSPELEAVLKNIDLVNEWGNLEEEIVGAITPANMNKSFNYLLLDPTLIENGNCTGDMFHTGIFSNTAKFQKFLESIFYIGKGMGTRPIAHLMEAMKIPESVGKSFKQKKMDKIREIWRKGMGVIVVTAFHLSSAKEANVYEASMIDAMTLSKLSNLKKGSYTGTSAVFWLQKAKNRFGAKLLFNCYKIFVVSPQKQIHPADLCAKKERWIG